MRPPKTRVRNTLVLQWKRNSVGHILPSKVAVILGFHLAHRLDLETCPRFALHFTIGS